MEVILVGGLALVITVVVVVAIVSAVGAVVIDQEESEE